MSRFNIYEFTPSVQDWLLWGQQNGIDERILNFISANSKYLDNFTNIEDLNNLDKTPDRRGWQRVSQIIAGKNELKNSHLLMVSGIVGMVAASKFFEFMDENRLLTGKELLSGDFSSAEVKLVSYTVPQIAALNDSIFIYLEGQNCKEKDKVLMAKNLNLYFDFLYKTNCREALAHFANMFSSPNYPNALVFVISECGDLYSKMTAFVGSIKQI